MRFIRFVVAAPDSTSQTRQGVFQAAADLCDKGALSEPERQLLGVVSKWFDKNLSEPQRSSRKRNAYHRDQRCIAWFKDSAAEHLLRIREIVAILEEHGSKVSMLETQRPGYIVYEDEFQVVAEPFAETET